MKQIFRNFTLNLGDVSRKSVEFQYEFRERFESKRIKFKYTKQKYGDQNIEKILRKT